VQLVAGEPQLLVDRLRAALARIAAQFFFVCAAPWHDVGVAGTAGDRWRQAAQSARGCVGGDLRLAWRPAARNIDGARGLLAGDLVHDDVVAWLAT
jgi:hypothetical protein